MQSALSLLKRYFGHNAFRPGQRELIGALLSGRDALGVMPTGAGKSVCYQLPALLLPGTALVVSPLISLMKDQVAALEQAGIPAAYINSSLTAEKYRETLRGAAQGRFKILYVAPERLLTESFLRLALRANISLVAVDEAHCVSQWGQDFRPSYLKVAGFLAALPKRPVVGAFTATATAQVKNDIELLLQLKNPLRLTTGFDRPNLYLDVERPRDKLGWLFDYLRARPGQSGIVYCATHKTVETVCGALSEGGIAAVRYHAGLEDAERRSNQDAFIRDQARVMVATNAFGMGIDKSNVSFVVHYNMPKNIESYYQEAGRAGRDGERAECILLFSPGDAQTARFLIRNSAENELLSEEQRETIHRRELWRLERMTAYCKTEKCLRGTLLRYFGETAPVSCGGCGNCLGETEARDITVEAQKILSAVVRVEQRFPSGLGMTNIILMLRGSRERRVMQLGLTAMPTYGALRGENQTAIRAYVDHLLREGYLTQSEGDYPVLQATEKAKDVLFHGETVTLVSRRRAPRTKAKPAPAAEAPQDSLFGALRALRGRLAREQDVPAYVIFSNATLSDMAQKRPHDREELLRVSGVGAVKAERYGAAFLEAVRLWEDETGKRGA